MSNFSSACVSEIASLFGAILAKSNNCDVMTFARDSQYKQYNPMDSVLTIRDSFAFTGGATNFKSIFTTANKKYDRVFILSYYRPISYYFMTIRHVKSKRRGMLWG